MLTLLSGDDTSKLSSNNEDDEGSDSTADGHGAGSDPTADIPICCERLPENFEMIGIQGKAEPLLEEQTSPYVVVAIQECSRMNVLLTEIRRSLTELQKGLSGALNMSRQMNLWRGALYQSGTRAEPIPQDVLGSSHGGPEEPPPHGSRTCS